MGRQCEVCGKVAVRGNKVRTRGKAKYLGGVGTKVTGISRREFKPNLQSLHVTVGKTNKKTLNDESFVAFGIPTTSVNAAPSNSKKWAPKL